VTLTTSFERVSLPLADPFTISRGTTETAENVVVRVEDESGTTGVGAAAPSTYYGETADTVAAVLPDLLAVVEDVGDPHARQRVERELRSVVGGDPAAGSAGDGGPAAGSAGDGGPAARSAGDGGPAARSAGGDPAARCAVDIALADLAANRLGVPCYRQWGLDPGAAPPTSFTVGMADPEEMRTKANAAVDRGFTHLKVKLDDERVRERVAAVRAGAPDARLRVDANGAWTPREAVDHSRTLADHGVAFVEQPVPADDLGGLQVVREEGVLPVAADESVTTAATVPRVADAVDIVVVKPMKCGSLRETQRVAAVAHAHGCEAMLGCMVASNAAIAASCHLAPLFDYADLDGALLLDSDPFAGVPADGGEFDLAVVGRGTGAVAVD